MFSEERRRKILEMLITEGDVAVRDLSSYFRTSQITIRKDLEVLHSEGRLERTRGGALLKGNGPPLNISLNQSGLLHVRNRIRIAVAAANKICPGQIIILGSGATSAVIAKRCRNIKRLTIITNATNIADELADSPVEVILTGGVLHPNSFSLVGPLAEESLAKLSADVLFLEGDGFDTKYGLTKANILEARISRAMVESAERTIVACDSSKFGRRSASLILPISAMQEMITDTNISQQVQESLQRENIKVTQV